MKIGVITYWSSSDNYGQQLQCYALQKYLRDKGHDAYLIKYAPKYSRCLWRNRMDRLTHLSFWLSLINGERKKKIEAGLKEQILFKENIQNNSKRDFAGFRKEFIKSTEIVYHSIEELRANPPQADLYITGSDQVWNNPLAQENTAGWYLAFGDRDIKRISYAASIGRDLRKKELPIFKKYLRAFNAISVREESSRLLCEHEGIRGVSVTLDPTMLLSANEYRKLETPAKCASPYMFMYILNVSNKEEIYWEQIQTYLETANLDLKIVCSSGYMQARELLESYHNIQATIPEWLGYIDNAQCIITTSFHGIVFCIKMHKPFLVILLTNKYAKGNDRIISLLRQLDLSNRIYNITESIETQMNVDIDWDSVEEKISSLQEISHNFLSEL